MSFVKEGEFEYIEKGSGHTIVLLHGLMGGLSNFEDTIEYFSKDYKVIIPVLPIYEYPLLKTSLKSFYKFLYRFIEHKKLDNFTLVGNSLGGHLALIYAKNHPEKVNSMVLTGSSGLYENRIGGSFPKIGNYKYIEDNVKNVFYDPKIATKEIVDEVYETLNNRKKIIRILALAKSAIRHNMSKDLPKMKTKTLVLWGDSDNVTPPRVAEEFSSLLPNSDLIFIEKCGHAAMMERPKIFNDLLNDWLSKNIVTK